MISVDRMAISEREARHGDCATPPLFEALLAQSPEGARAPTAGGSRRQSAYLGRVLLAATEPRPCEEYEGETRTESCPPYNSGLS